MTKGSLEATIANAVVRFQREQHGRGAETVRAHIVGELVIVRSIGIFTATEARLAASEEGRRLIKSARYELRSLNQSEIENIIAQILGCKVLHSFFDVNVQVMEQFEGYVLETDIEKRLLREDLNRLGQINARRNS